jgi:hypothetical protein
MHPIEGEEWLNRAIPECVAQVKGLAQSIAKPAYRRLLTAEPALRRAVPALETHNRCAFQLANEA